MFNRTERLDAIVHYAIFSSPKSSIHRPALQTALWLADIAHFRSFSISVTWADRYSLIDDIPTPHGLDESIERLKSLGFVREYRRIFSRSPGLHLRSRRFPDSGYVSPRSLHTVKDATMVVANSQVRNVRNCNLVTMWTDWPQDTEIPLDIAAEYIAIDVNTIDQSRLGNLRPGRDARAAVGPVELQYVRHGKGAVLADY